MAFATALDALLRAWSEGEQPTADDLCRRFDGLGDDVAAVIELAREIAVVRPSTLPTVPGYDVLGEIGRGGMGVVYRARQRALGRIVALKVLPEAAADARGRTRFLAEARGLGRIRNPHVVTIHEVIETADVCAYAMEWIQGRSLLSLLEELADWPRRGPAPRIAFGSGAATEHLPPLPLPWFCRTGIAIARGLAAVHQEGLVHRDVKPSNVLLRPDGMALLSDFGLVRAEDLGLTRTGQVVGTPAFAAPEQLRGERDITAAADVFALGATLHCMLAGEVPFAGRTPHELLAAIGARRRPRLDRLSLPKDLETIVARCLEPESRDRYQSAVAVADDLENLLALRPLSIRPLGALPRAVRMLRRNRRTVVAAAASAVLVLAACAALAWWIYDLATLPGRIGQQLLAARYCLLEPRHEERVELADLGRPTGDATAFARTGDDAIRAYDRALLLAPDRVDIQCERAVVAAAQQLLRRATPELPAWLEPLAPATCAAARHWADDAAATTLAMPSDIFDADRRLLGLLAFLCGRVGDCHAAWAPFEVGGDTFLDAAAGQLYLQRGDVARAGVRLSRAAQTWPDAGFLAVGLADCAVRQADLDLAERELARAARLGLKNTFDTEIRVRADLRAAQGRFAEARADYEWMLEHHVAPVAREHYGAMLERLGDWRRALELALADRAVTDTADDRRVLLAARWWYGLPHRERYREFGRVFGGDSACLLAQIAAAAPRWLSRESRTVAPTPDSAEVCNAQECVAHLSESTLMNRHHCTSFAALSPLPRTVLTHAAAWMTSVRSTGSGWSRTTATTTRAVFPILVAAAWTIWPAAAMAQTAVWTDATLPSGNPPARDSHMTAIDPVTGDVLICGGGDRNPAVNWDDMWAWNGTTWTHVGTTPGGAGTILSSGRMVGVPSLRKVLAFGGANSGGALGDAWLWDGTTWSNVTGLSAQIPPARFNYGLAYDAARDRVVLHSGSSGGTNILSDTWEWNPATMQWRSVNTLGPARRDLDMAYDAGHRYVVLHGGVDGPGGTQFNETWTWDGLSWSLRAGAAPATMARRYHGMTWDESRQRVVLFGGINNAFAIVNEVREWTGSTWTAPMPTASPSAPSARGLLPIIYHPATNRVVAFGGLVSLSNPQAATNTTWTLSTPSLAFVSDNGAGCTSLPNTAPPALSRVAGTGPFLGENLTLRLDGLAAPPQYVHMLAIDVVDPVAPLSPPLSSPGCTLRVGLGYLQFFLLHGGSASLDLAIPTSTSFVGLQFFAQGASLDLTFAPGVFVAAMSNGVACTIGQR